MTLGAAFDPISTRVRFMVLKASEVHGVHVLRRTSIREIRGLKSDFLNHGIHGWTRMGQGQGTELHD